MEKCFVKTSWGGLIALSWTFLFFVGAAPFATAAQPQQARVSQVIQDVRLLEAHTASRPAVVNDKLILGTAVRTGVESRVELTFSDLTITRLGANTIFSFSRGARELELTSGAVLLEVPPNKAPVRVNTSAVTVAITGGTALFATGPPTKFMVLEGIGTFYPAGHPEKAVTVHGGEMVMMTADGHITKPEKFDVKLVIETSRLILDFPPLTNLPLILAVVNQQIAEQQMAGTTSQTLARNLVDVIDVTDQNANANPVVLASTSTQSPPPPPPPPPPPTPSKFGTPVPISSPNPYLITSGTVITTDPSITTKGVTDFGKIWRGTSIDGPLSAFIFGSTSAFDTVIGLDAGAEKVADSGAVFKFASLELTGNPTVLTTNGEINLALVGVNGITSGGPGGTLTFAGISTLLLATQNGSIVLGPEISFSGFQHLVFYARGAGSNLTLASPISATIHLNLFAEGSIQVSSVDATLTAERIKLLAGDSITLDGGVMSATATNSNGNVNIVAGNDISITNGLEIDRTFGGQPSGLNVSLSAGTDFTLGSSLAINVDNSVAGNLNDGANITLDIGNNLTINGGGALSLLIANNDGGHIGTGGNVSLMTGGNLTADSMSVAINNRAGGFIDSGVNLTLNIGGALTTLHDGVDFLGNTASLSLAISNRYDNNTPGSFIGGDAALLFHSDSASIGGILSVLISDRGGTIDGNALLNFSVTHDITVQGTDDTNFQGESAATWQILTGDGANVGSPIGGTIHGNATLLLSATNLTVPAGSLDVDIDNPNYGVVGSGGTIDSDATIRFSLTGNLSTQSSADFAIRNQLQPGGTTGGTIGGDATINVTAANISTGVDSSGSSLDGLINNATGNIGGNAIVNVDVAEAITAQGPANFQILNNDGGHIGGNANILVTTSGGGDLTANSIFAFINNHNTGSIDSGANLTFNIGGALVTQGDATFVISNLNEGPGGGTIGSLASVDINAASISVGGFFQTFVGANGGGSIAGNASNTVNVTGDLVVQGPILADIQDTGFIQINPTIFIAGGHIGGDATVTLAAQNITTFSTTTGVPGIDTMALEASIYSNGSGTIGGNAIVNVRASQNISAPGTVFFTVANGNYQGFGGGTIGGDAQVNVTAGSLSTGALFDDIYNYGGASIGGGAAINLTANTLSVGGNLDALIDNSSGGTIGGNATIDMNVSGSATVTSDATFQIFGSDGAASAAINFNGGSYDAGGTFLAYIDGNGTVTFNNASAHADVLKAGVFGANGVLSIGGGTLSADSTLKLYAPGSNGQLNFVSNVTLGGNSAKILAANSVTIFNNVVVTVGGKAPADVYTNNANYSEKWGGNGTTTGTFAGAGANRPRPLSDAPPFGALSPGNPINGKRSRTVINIPNSGQLLSLLDGAVPGRDGRLRVPRDKHRHAANADRLNVNRMIKADRDMADVRHMRDRGVVNNRLGSGARAF